MVYHVVKNYGSYLVQYDSLHELIGGKKVLGWEHGHPIFASLHGPYQVPPLNDGTPVIRYEDHGTHKYSRDEDLII